MTEETCCAERSYWFYYFLPPFELNQFATIDFQLASLNLLLFTLLFYIRYHVSLPVRYQLKSFQRKLNWQELEQIKFKSFFFCLLHCCLYIIVRILCRFLEAFGCHNFVVYDNLIPRSIIGNNRMCAMPSRNSVKGRSRKN